MAEWIFVPVFDLLELLLLLFPDGRLPTLRWRPFRMVGRAQRESGGFRAGFLTVPVAIAVAILRYRLYDIDILINRTLVYGPLTATLALVYVGSVVGLQTVFRSISGQKSTLAVVASTLAIAALFNPMPRWVHALGSGFLGLSPEHSAAHEGPPRSPTSGPEERFQPTIDLQLSLMTVEQSQLVDQHRPQSEALGVDRALWWEPARAPRRWP